GTGAANGGQDRAELFYLANPPVGAANVVITLGAGKNKRIVGGAVTFFGVDQTTTVGTSNTNTGNTTTPTVTLSSASGQVVVDAMTANGDAGTPTVGSGQTQSYNDLTGTGGG